MGQSGRGWPRRCWALIAACVLLLAVPVRAGTLPVPHRARVMPRVIPDTYGAIRQITLHYDPNLAYELEPVYADLFSALPFGVRVRVLCPSAEAAARFIEEWGLSAPSVDLDIINVGMPLSVWARDRYLARQWPVLQRPAAGFVPVDNPNYEPEKFNELMLPSILSPAHVIPYPVASRIYLEGGNVVSNVRGVFVGGNVVTDNAGAYPEWHLRRELHRLVGRECVVIGAGGAELPWDHVDMYLTPIDERTVLVGSPELACGLLCPQEEAVELPDACFTEQHGDACPSDYLQARFDSVAEALAARGYRVLRLPVIVDGLEKWMITYNNVVMDRRGGQRTVYMPVYHEPVLDNAAAEVYETLGFDVRGIDVSRIYMLGGALRCLVNVTERRPPGRTNVPTLARGGGRMWYTDLGDHLLTDDDTEAEDDTSEECRIENLLESAGSPEQR